MEVTLSPDLEALVREQLATGAYTDVEDLLRCALERLAEEECPLSPAELERLEESRQQALRGEVKTREQVWRDMAAFQEQWIREHDKS